MPSADLRITEADWAGIRSMLDGSFRSEFGEERGVLALLGENTSPRHPCFTVVEVVTPFEGDVRATPVGLSFDSRYLRRVHLRMRERGVAGIGTFHTHPLSDENVAFSRTVDDVEDPQLIANLIEVAPGTRLISVVLGRRSQAGRVWRSPKDVQPLSHLVVVGERLQTLRLDGSPPGPPPPIEAIFDRARAITPEGALHMLANMMIAVVGVSGIGSVLAELLVRAGARRLMLIDHDLIELINLNRVLHSRLRDINAPKVRVVERGLSELGGQLEIDATRGTVLDRAVLARLRDADVIFGCVDRAWPRDLLADFALRYLIPYIDLGSEIGADKERTTIISLDSRVNYIVPGRPCLRCAGVVTPPRLAFESLAKEERERVAALGYSDDLSLKQPAVMDLNMRAAGLGALLLRHLLQPFLLTPLPAMILENVVTYAMRAVRTVRMANPQCPICRTNPFTGCGDCAPPLGLEGDALVRLLGSEPDLEAPPRVAASVPRVRRRRSRA